MSGTFMLLLWTAGILTAGVVIIAAVAFRDFTAREAVEMILRVAIVIIVAALGWTWLDYSIVRERQAERRALDARATELTARAIAPDSALACLTVENEAVETACEQAVFANPQAVAAAIAYMDARLNLLADGVELATRDPSYIGELNRPRRVIEADRFGIVAHVLAIRGCKPDDCSVFKLLRDSKRLSANLKERTFETRLAAYAANWTSGRPATAASATPTTATAVAPVPANATPSAGQKLSAPSSPTIPPVSIMTPEPTGSVSTSTESNAPRPDGAPAPTRRQSANKPPAAKPPVAPSKPPAAQQ